MSIYSDFWRTISDDMAVFDEFDPRVSVTWPTRRLKTYDPEKYETVPKKEYKQILIKQAEEEIKSIEDKLAKAKEKLKELKSD